MQAHATPQSLIVMRDRGTTTLQTSCSSCTFTFATPLLDRVTESSITLKRRESSNRAKSHHVYHGAREERDSPHYAAMMGSYKKQFTRFGSDSFCRGHAAISYSEAQMQPKAYGSESESTRGDKTCRPVQS